MTLDDRESALAQWVDQQLQQLKLNQPESDAGLDVVSGDASFRRYFRTRSSAEGVTWIAVDAPPEKEDSRSFVAIARAWIECGVHVPEVLAADFDQGFMLLSDLGDDLYLPQLANNSDALYLAALSALVKIQRCHETVGYKLPHYNQQKLRDEMQLCPEWFFEQLLGLVLTSDDKSRLCEVFDRLVESALEQPQVCVHRDYHSRNLMALPNGNVGVLDFQDAVIGPVTYDLVSLLRDCYISWSAEQEEKWISDYIRLAGQQDIWSAGEAPSYGCFKRWFDWMGLQRHIKCVGIFSRLYLRDGKAGYLQDIPRTFGYLKKVCEEYPEFAELNSWLDRVVVPAMAECAQLQGGGD